MSRWLWPWLGTRQLLVSDAVGVSRAAVVRSSACAARHSFKIVQMPANLLEVTGLATAPAMHKAGLKVAKLVKFLSRGSETLNCQPVASRQHVSRCNFWSPGVQRCQVLGPAVALSFSAPVFCGMGCVVGRSFRCWVRQGCGGVHAPSQLLCTLGDQRLVYFLILIRISVGTSLSACALGFSSTPIARGPFFSVRTLYLLTSS